MTIAFPAARFGTASWQLSSQHCTELRSLIGDEFRRLWGRKFSLVTHQPPKSRSALMDEVEIAREGLDMKERITLLV